MPNRRCLRPRILRFRATGIKAEATPNTEMTLDCRRRFGLAQRVARTRQRPHPQRPKNRFVRNKKSE